MNIVCIVQARMDSSRFPGKALADLAGHPILEHVVARCVASGLPTVIATTARDVDDPILMWAAVQNPPVAVFRWGDDANSTHVVSGAANVLSRYIFCADAYAADAIVRITGDSPLVPIEVIEVVAQSLRDGNALASLASGFGVVPDGWEAEGCTVECLKRLNAELPTREEREHVFPGLYTRAIGRGEAYTPSPTTPLPEEWNYPWLMEQKFSVDTPADLEWLNRLAEYLDLTPPDPPSDKIVTVLREHPELQRPLARRTT